MPGREVKIFKGLFIVDLKSVKKEEKKEKKDRAKLRRDGFKCSEGWAQAVAQ